MALGSAVWIGAISQSWLAPWRASILFLIIVAAFSWARQTIAVVLISAALLGSGVMSFRQTGLESSHLRALVGHSVIVNFQVVSDPTQTAPRLFGSSRAPISFSFLATALKLEDGAKFRLRIPIRVITSDRKSLQFLPGQMVRARGVVKETKEARVAVVLLAKSNIVPLTGASHWAKLLGGIRSRLRVQSKHDDAGALIPGMIIGDTSLQSVQFKTAMRRAGLTHLVAVSGANFAIISLFVLWCMQWVVKSIRWRMAFTAIALFGFICLVRPSPSVLRAAAMASVVLAARGAGRRADPLPALGFAIAVVVIGDPWQAREVGFALSVLATAGLLLVSPALAHWLSRFFPHWIAGAIGPPLSAVVMCAPVLISLTGYLGLMTVVANILAAPVVAPITIIGFIAALLTGFAPGVSAVLLWSLHFPAEWIVKVAYWSADFPVLQLGSGLVGFFVGLAILLFLTLLLLSSQRSRRLIFFTTFVLILTTLWSGRWPPGEWDVANCDVGQGDSLVLNLGDHRGVVIDAGPDAQLEDRCLRQLGINVVSLLILTHFHADHVAGLSGLLHNRKVESVWTSANTSPLTESHRVRALLAGVPTTTVTRGYSAVIRGSRRAFTLAVLWPDSSVITTADISGDGSEINNSSIAVDIRSADFSLFAGGDIEPEVQAKLLPLAPVDIYKVSHHGSAYQDAAFMREISPTLSLISVGRDNTYGHPSARTISALTRLGSKVYRTDKDGAIAVVAHDHRLTVRTNGGRWWRKVRLS